MYIYRCISLQEILNLLNSWQCIIFPKTWVQQIKRIDKNIRQRRACPTSVCVLCFLVLSVTFFFHVSTHPDFSGIIWRPSSNCGCVWLHESCAVVECSGFFHAQSSDSSVNVELWTAHVDIYHELRHQPKEAKVFAQWQTSVFLLFCLPHFIDVASRSLFVEVATCDMKQLGCVFMFHRAQKMQLSLPRVPQAAGRNAPVIAVGRKVMSVWNSSFHASASINQNYTVSPFLLTAQMVCLGAGTVT